MDPALTSGARPDPEDRPDLTAQASAHHAMPPPAGRGTLRTYLGIAPGVGKTYAMLRDARARRRSGSGACQLVIGSRRRSRWSRLLTGSTVADQVLRAAGDLPVQVVNVGRPDQTSDEWRRPGHDTRQHRTASGNTAQLEAARRRPPAGRRRRPAWRFRLAADLLTDGVLRAGTWRA
jgi:K+-sensing histidine kinase KdpD